MNYYSHHDIAKNMIAKKLVNGFDEWESLGQVNIKTNENLVLFNYSRQAQYDNIWTPFEMASRGLIIDKITGEIVALPFHKFFNWGEGERYSKGNIVSVTEKMDGSLGILYRQDGNIKIATRGSFDGEQAIWATNYINNNNYKLDFIPNELTLMFEIIYPENQVGLVLNYDNQERLVLLSCRNRFTGNYLSYQDTLLLGRKVGFEVVNKVEMNDTKSLIDCCKTLIDAEGFVAEFSDGQHFKFKGEWYFELHKIIAGYSPKKVCEWWIESTHLKNISVLPDELHEEANQICYELNLNLAKSYSKIQEYMSMLSNEKLETRKDKAIWIRNNVPKEYISFLFSALDMKDYSIKVRKLVVDKYLSKKVKAK